MGLSRDTRGIKSAEFSQFYLRSTLVSVTPLITGVNILLLAGNKSVSGCDASSVQQESR